MRGAVLMGGVVVAVLSALPRPAGAAGEAGAIRLAQSGSAGGSVGKGEKSLSGDEDAPRSSAPAARRPPAERRGSERPRRAAAPVSYDGAWTVRSVGETCAGGVTQPVVITSGRIIGQGVSGTVSASGAVRTSGEVQGTQVSGRGQLTARGGQGTFSQSDGCTGRWFATKQ